MELNDENLSILAQYLQQTLNPDPNVRRPAEKSLESVEINQNYAMLLLHLVDKAEVDMTIRIAGAVAFKNYIKRNWNAHADDDGPNRIHDADRFAIKSLIITLMLKSPLSIQKQISAAVSIIGKYDFPAKWPQLIDEMVDKFATGDFNVINGVLQTAHSLFKRYRYEFKSQALWEEIKLVLDRLSQPLTGLLLATMNLTTVHAGNEAVLKVIYASLALVCKVFYSLNYQDLPEFFEDNMETWMTAFLKLLTTDVGCLKTADDEDAGVLEQLRSQVCDNLCLYAQKYDEEFSPYMPQFVTAVWELLVNTGNQTKYDALVSNSLQFLATVADRNHYRHLFEDPTVLASICEKVIIPNMDFRTSDEELFEDNPEEYIRRDIEGSDIDTRRRAACDLVKTLSHNFEQKIFEIFGQYLQVLLNKYAEAPTVNWRAKDTAIFLVTSLASKGGTQKHGITQTSQLVPLPQFCQQQIIPELERQDINEIPVLKADALKFIMTFRSLLGGQTILGCLPQIIRHLPAQSIVVHSYAACAIEKILIMRGPDTKLLVSMTQLQPVATELLNGLFATLTVPGSTENEYIMKAIMRSFSTLQEVTMPFMSLALPRLTEILTNIAKNPSRPHFNHYLFETLSICIKIVCKVEKNAVNSFEEALFPVFQGILQQDILEFIPYVFQMLSLLLEVRDGSGAIPGPYWELFPCLLAPTLWDRSGNVTPLIRLISAYIKQGAGQISSDKKLSAILGIFQKMIASKNNDHEGFYLMQTLVLYYPLNELQEFMRQIFVLLFKRLCSTKTTKYVRGLVIFFSFYSAKMGARQLIEIIDSLQETKLFQMVLTSVLIPNIGKISDENDKKVIGVGIVRMLCDDTPMIVDPYKKHWVALLQSLIQTFELPPDETTIDGDHFVEIEDTPGYQVAYSQLNFAQPKDIDPFPEVTDCRKFLLEKLAGNFSLISSIISEMSDDYKQIIQKYCTQYGINLA